MIKLVVALIVIGVMVRLAWKLLNWAWLKPKKLEKWLREEGFDGTPYKLLIGDFIQQAKMMKESRLKASPITHDITPLVMPFDHHIVKTYGKRSYLWFGPVPRVFIMDPQLIKDIFLRPFDFEKPHPDPLRDSIVGGIVTAEGEKWHKERQIINPAFLLKHIQNMFPLIILSCNSMIEKWEKLTLRGGLTEVDVCPFIDNLAGDVISRTAFGSCYEEGHVIFRILREQTEYAIENIVMIFLPGGRSIPTRANRKYKDNEKELQAILRKIIDKRNKSLKIGEDSCDDLLGTLLKSNAKAMEGNGVGMSLEDVIEECKTFYNAGSETTSRLIAWTMVCLCLHPEWQIKARQEVQEVFGSRELDFESLKQLKIVTMILNEVLRLYPPVVMVTRATTKETELGNMMMPAGIQIAIPILEIHHDREIWGEDASEFKPERFTNGIGDATKDRGSHSFLPFTGGPRICIGQNFAMVEAKVAIVKILQRFSFELSPSYKHSLTPVFTLTPNFGVHVVLRTI
uniref:cytochrome P450 72A397-like isoform X1 n=1 Tax=Erigeron canadensis TaxID=72917 RepID=UPI001CB8F20D|nr:cytochrome P450 72A397-like isoform X1 [Erigeron canadensis]